MSKTVLTFFNNKGGVGKTSLVYHLALMYAELGVRVLAVDLDPQSNLTAAFLNEDQLAALWSDGAGVSTIFKSIKPLLDTGDFAPVQYQAINDRLALVAGDLALSGFEDQLSEAWTKVLGDDGKSRSFRILSAFWRVAQDAASRFKADLILVDVGPDLGAINRSALLGSNHVVVPLGADLFSLQGLRNLGPTLRRWRDGWNDRLARRGNQVDFELPVGDMLPAGYIAMRHSVQLTRPVKAYTRWLDQIPGEFRKQVLDQAPSGAPMPSFTLDENCLATLKNYNSLMPLGQEARKPIFALKSADGAIGAHAGAVQEAFKDFAKLAREIAARIGLSIRPI